MSNERLIKAGNQLLGMFAAVMQGAGISSDTTLKMTNETTGKSAEITVLDAVKEWVAAAKEAA